MPLSDFLTAYRGREAAMQAEPMRELQQAGVLQGVLAKMQAAQKEQAFRQAIAAAKTPEEQVAIAAKFSGPESVMRTGTASLDRRALIRSKEMESEAAREARIDALTQRGEQEIARVREAEAQRRITKEEADRREAAMRENITRLAASLRPAPAPQPLEKIIGTGGRPVLASRENAIGKTPWSESSNARAEKISQEKRKSLGQLNLAITELEKATADGGLIDQSTGSGAGALVDIGAGFFGKATPGSIAVGQMKPIFDLALKMVPRFEGPQSDKDTKTYMEAAGELANPNAPNPRKKAAGKTVIQLMKARRGQFITKDMEGTDTDSGGGTPTFATEAEAIASGVKGKVIIGGRPASID